MTMNTFFSVRLCCCRHDATASADRCRSHRLRTKRAGLMCALPSLSVVWVQPKAAFGGLKQ